MYFTEKQLKIMEFIQQFRAERGISPTLEEIAEYFGVTKITIYEHINQLERKGALKREKFRARSIELLVPVEERTDRFLLPLLGQVRGGAAIETADDGRAGELSLSDVLPIGKRFFALRAGDDSLAPAGIIDGDYISVEKRDPLDGETVVVEMAGEGTSLRRYHVSGEHRFLESVGAASETADAADCDILYVAIGVLRHFANGTSQSQGAVGSDTTSATA